MKKALTVLLLCIMLPFIGLGDVLLWSVNESTRVDGGDIQQFLVPYPEDDDHFSAARVKLVSNNGTSSTILKIYAPDEEGIWGWQDGDWGVWLTDNGNGQWGAEWNQSETGYNTINPIQNQLNGDIMSYPPEILDALFIMELGYNEWDDNANNGAGDYVWRTLAQSAPELYRDLVIQHMYASGDIAPPGYTPWSPDFYTNSVPEPSSTLLVLIGFSVLGLKRKI